MIPKRILVPSRLRRTPTTGWSWVDRRFVADHVEQLSREAVLLYFFLAAVADRNGLSFYREGTLASLLRMTPPAIIQARDELLARDLIAHESPLTQVLSLPPRGEQRRARAGDGLIRLADVFRQITAPSVKPTDSRQDRRSS